MAKWLALLCCVPALLTSPLPPAPPSMPLPVATAATTDAALADDGAPDPYPYRNFQIVVEFTYPLSRSWAPVVTNSFWCRETNLWFRLRIVPVD